MTLQKRYNHVAAAGSNDTVMNSIAQELAFSGMIKIRLI